jgi:hypothetical protein
MKYQYDFHTGFSRNNGHFNIEDTDIVTEAYLAIQPVSNTE